jgi:hypothetical protein
LRLYAEKANKYHELSKKSWRRALRHAEAAGSALCRARKLHRKRGTWTPWLRENFKGSVETARIYMRVHRQWKTPEVREARKRGDISSLNTFLAFSTKAKAQAAEPLGPEAKVPSDDDMLRKDITELCRVRLRHCDPKLLEIICDNFYDLWDRLMKGAKEYALPDHLYQLLGPPTPDYPWEAPVPYTSAISDEHNELKRRMAIRKVRNSNSDLGPQPKRKRKAG